jgi:hypothetical protein
MYRCVSIGDADVVVQMHGHVEVDVHVEVDLYLDVDIQAHAYVHLIENASIDVVVDAGADVVDAGAHVGVRAHVTM